MNCGIENRSEGEQTLLQQGIIERGTVSWKNCQQAKYHKRWLRNTLFTWIPTVLEESKGIPRSGVLLPPVPEKLGHPRVETAGKGRTKWRNGRRSKKREEGRFAWIWSTEEKGLESCWEKPGLRLVPSFHTHTCTRWALVRRGYVGGLSGLLTGLPPFIIAGSLVLLLGGTAALGTVSPTSCNDGSLYMATGEGDDRERKDKERTMSKIHFHYVSVYRHWRNCLLPPVSIRTFWIQAHGYQHNKVSHYPPLYNH